MNTITKQQEAQLSQLVEHVSSAMDEVDAALSTTLMSDAKSAVYALWAAVKDDKAMPEPIQQELFARLDAAWLAIVGSGTTHERSKRSYEKLAHVRRYLWNILAKN